MLSVERERHIVEVTVPIDGMLLRGEDELDDMYAAIDSVVDKIERQIHKYKTKINRKARQKGAEFDPITENSIPELMDEPEEEEPRVVKVKQVPMKPMDVEEAILQMNLLGHDFFVFRNAEDARTNVVYRRRDGNYGLIGPEV
jgi:putative sigma-54 modulation protein